MSASMRWMDLEAGQLFAYKGPRRLFFFRTEGFGQILRLDSEDRIVHVRLFKIRDDGESGVLIGHVPILFGAFEQSVSELVETAELQEDWQPAYNAWRRRYEAGEVGAFSISLQEIATESGSFVPTDVDLEYALPKKGNNGEYNVLEAGTPKDDSSHD